MKKQGISPNWGGERTGSGRKAKPISEKEKRKLLRALKAQEKKIGKTWQVMLTEMAYDTDHKKEQGSSLKLIAELLITKESRSVSEKHVYEHGVVELPPLMKGAVDVRKEEKATA